MPSEVTDPQKNSPQQDSKKMRLNIENVETIMRGGEAPATLDGSLAGFKENGNTEQNTLASQQMTFRNGHFSK